MIAPRQLVLYIALGVVALFCVVGFVSARAYLIDTRVTIAALSTKALLAEQRSANALELLGAATRRSDSLATLASIEREHATALAKSSDALRAERERLMVRVSDPTPGPTSESPTAAESGLLARTTTALSLAVAETDTLRAEIVARDALEAMQAQQITLLHAAVDSVAAALGASDQLNRAQRAAMARMEPRCHSLFGVGCLSRKTAVVVGVAVTLTAQAILTR